jgi:serine/threonine-protein kinase
VSGRRPISPDRWRALSPYLDRALEMDAAERTAWLASVGAADPALAAELRTLLLERDTLSQEGFLQDGPSRPPAPASLAGQTVGAYTLVSLIGQGGMGSVWLARRSDGRFEGVAAVKLLNAELVGQVGEERFQREGGILARLIHPHIARLVDAGVSSSGQPYLVLEHVEGEHIDRYCDAKALGVEARIRLFLDVLSAVTHAHAHLVVHRDIKPSNVLVSRAGDAKLLDFGIAKLLEGDGLTGEDTALTREGGRALTLEYAAPEQVSGQPITTATDVYALAVLLYVLLGGQHPAGSAIRSPADLLRAIVDSEPPRLSSLPTMPEKLRRVLRGDLDTIVARALKKQPQERYPSVTAMADDLRRYLQHEPISTRADTLAYRAGKFVRRNRVPVALAALVVAALVAGLAGTIWQAREASRQRDLALGQLVRAESINEFSNYLLGQAAPDGEAVTMRELLGRAEQMIEKRFATEEALATELLGSIGVVYYVLGDVDNATRTVGRAYEASQRVGDPAVRAQATCSWARTLAQSGKFTEARRLIETARGLISTEARFDNIAAECLLDRGFIATREGDTAVALESAQMALARLSGVPTAFAATRANALHLLARAHQTRGDTGAADRKFTEAMEQLERLGRDRTTVAATLLNNWALTRAATDTLGALALQRRCIEIFRQPAGLSNYGRLLNRLARYHEAIPIYQTARDTARKQKNVWVMGAASLGLARAYRSLGDLDRAQAALSEAGTALRAYFSGGHYSLADVSREEGLLADARGDAEAARRLLSEALLVHAQAKEKHLTHIETLLELAKLELRSGRRVEAEKHASSGLALAEGFRSGVPHSAWVGLSQLELGKIREAGGDATAAEASFGEALVHLAPTLGASHPATREAQAKSDSP